MNESDLRYFKEQLLNMRRDLLSQVDSITDDESELSLREEDGDNSAYSYHLADQGTDNNLQEQSFFLIERDSRFLYKIEQALDRIADGSFGLCTSCESPIALERLQALPYAELCVQCQADEEGNPDYMGNSMLYLPEEDFDSY